MIKIVDHFNSKVTLQHSLTLRSLRVKTTKDNLEDILKLKNVKKWISENDLLLSQLDELVLLCKENRINLAIGHKSVAHPGIITKFEETRLGLCIDSYYRIRLGCFSQKWIYFEDYEYMKIDLTTSLRIVKNFKGDLTPFAITYKEFESLCKNLERLEKLDLLFS